MLLAVGVALSFAVSARAQEAPRLLRIGIIGCDTSHAGVFTSTFNAPKAAADPDLAGFKVVAAYPGGSPDLPLSRDRLGKFVETLKTKYGVEIVDSIEKLLAKVDVVLLLSVDGRVHWKQSELVLKSHKPVFIDKPFAQSLADAMRIVELSKETKTPILSCSSLRWSKALSDLKTDAKKGPVIGCMTWGNCPYFEHHPDLAFYGIHGLEMTYAIMGPGCVSVARTHTKDTDVVTGVWADGRVATYRGIRSGKDQEFGGMVFCKGGNVGPLKAEGYTPMLREIGKFFRTGVSPVGTDEMLEVIAVIEAADVSKAHDGAPVALADVMKAAKAKLTP
ncbi:MAG TPA: Gfo/Idh/MocA family oxidoreductase [Gemmataceae bacterium]|jgi:predicted dehydrogenase|nr:Gfo/Idh/MocA family oxidoreductase [Gemmataceae bacterium]